MLRIAPVFALYMMRRFLSGLVLVYLPVLALIYMIDLLELTRRASRVTNVEADFLTLVQMSAMKLPGLAAMALPFACLFGGMWTFARMTRSNELIIARAAGLSVWQFLAPPMMVALLLGIFTVGIVNPWSSALNYHYRQLEAFYIKGTSSSLSTVTESGLWLRQADKDGSAVIHALSASDGGLRLSAVVVFMFDPDEGFQRRIEAFSAKFDGDVWTLSDAWVIEPDHQPQAVPVYRLATNLHPEDIQQSLANPDSVSFWAIPQFAQRLEAAGFSSTRYLIQWHSLASMPLVLCAMVLVAATVSLRHSRRGGVAALISLGGVAGFALFVVSDIARALGIAESVPILLAAWGPAVAATLVGIALLFHLEDG
ncbi:LPS export ABC transporter permease LptG [Zavarzinia compransoris]|uniref:LPS export ABC transporter permease LptG n=1 Tax=Zavarzinia marina TaxID=2911065 RepID=UPI001F2DA696|nr:LPS export ABC transporter permease LptG [Zavarzinia marina]MCF4164449.1 LPS export ABC transporter permease LptG [Zavarzinia marina]